MNANANANANASTGAGASTGASVNPLPSPGGPRLPLDFTAFHELCSVPYRHFTCLRLADPDAAEATVCRAFADLAHQWARVLRCPRPAAVAWQLLSAHIAEALVQQGAALPPTVARTLYALMPEHQADLVLLRHLQGLSCEAIAELVGREPADVAYQLKAAHRCLAVRRLLTESRSAQRDLPGHHE
ncbi:hypothetical protein [Streptomyces cinnamoneus]|uniref:RNA polymerase sigma factor 70 region 4 type 2 domain-containing protein n=1 Tax=Streptomyces cinnamoneus TaxID=53446 RepID=A0A918TBV2_STRCJ|nr:hypothetical protein [Streptomyces cinnamoneus]GHC40145.1 hypothetical protein GCM10010507_12770 [Streptomyces cinnamoneus]